MNYEEMSDFEINKAVCIALGYEVRVGDKYNENFKLNFPHSVWFIRSNQEHCEHRDFCNDPSHTDPIITDNKISLFTKGDTWVASTDVFSFYMNRKEIHHIDNNRLRAACIVFLKMKERDQ